MHKYLFLIGLSFALSAPVMAQEAGAVPQGDPNEVVFADRMRDEYITVLASGMQARVDASGQAISVVGADEIDTLQGPDLARVIERLPGVTLVRNGSLGGFTGLFVRGANSQQVLVLVDGVRVADAAAPSGGYDFGNLMTGPIGKVELLRGSNSVIWGSGAIGGVIAFTSREVEGVEGSLEYGAREMLNGDVTSGFASEHSALSLSAGYTETDGISSSASGTEPDGFRQYRIAGRARLGLTDSLSLVASGRYADGRSEFDGFSFAPPFGLIDTPEFTETKEASGRVGLAYQGDDLDLEAAFSHYTISRDNFNSRFGTDPGFASDGKQQRAEVKGRYDLSNNVRIDFGADHEWSRFDTNFDEPASERIGSGHAMLGWRSGRVNVAAGVRIDDHSRFGSAVTLGANGSYDLADNWRLRASYGEGFKAPTLYQLRSDFGNPALSPERSKSYDLGVEKGERTGRLHFALTAFQRDTRGLIDFVSCFSVTDPLCADSRFGFYRNVGRARAKGLELELGARMTETLSAQASYTYVKAKDRSAGGFNQANDLARRPRHAVSVSLDWTTPLAGLALGADARMVGKSFDDAGNFTRLESYALGTVRAAVSVTERIELFGRIENVTDTQYQTAAGYATAGRSAFVGARARF